MNTSFLKILSYVIHLVFKKQIIWETLANLKAKYKRNKKITKLRKQAKRSFSGILTNILPALQQAQRCFGGC
jgi:hypothetical protein